MQKYIYGYVLLYAIEHTIKEIQEFFCFPNYGATKRYLLLHNIKHLAESRAGKNNSNYRHGGKHTRLYSIWCGMKSRCYNKNGSHYPRWGAEEYKYVLNGFLILATFSSGRYIMVTQTI